MAVKVTERFTGPRFERGEGTLRAVREFDVSGVDNVADAEIATDASGSPAIPEYNAEHPNNSSLKVRDRQVRKLAPDLYRVRVRYARPKNKSRHNEPTNDPLDEPAKLRWRMGSVEVPVDADPVGNAIVNSARAAFGSDPRDMAAEYSLIVRRNEPFYDPFFAKEMHMAVNDDLLNISAISIAEAGNARLMRFAPSGDYEPSADYVEVEYEFALRENRQNQPAQVNPFWIRMLDQGFHGKNQRDETVKLYDADGEEPTEEVLLNGEGKPLNSDWRIGKDNQQPGSGSVPEGAVKETVANDLGLVEAVWLWYRPRQYKEKSFSRLGL